MGLFQEVHQVEHDDYDYEEHYPIVRWLIKEPKFLDKFEEEMQGK
jgi:hypothetical protein